MTSARAGLLILTLSAVLSVLCHPRVFFGNGGGSAVFSLDDFYFAASWAALALALVALIVSGSHWSSIGRPLAPTVLFTPVMSLLLVTYNVFAGIPHKANSASWGNGELGIAAFMRGQQRRAKENLKANPIAISADAFHGKWRGLDGTVYTFESNNLRTHSDVQNRAFAEAGCAESFSIRYVERDREVLQDLGLTWSAHAAARYDSTALDAKIPVAEVACGTERFAFIRATPTEIWRWTNLLGMNDIKSESFVLTLVSPTQ